MSNMRYLSFLLALMAPAASSTTLVSCKHPEYEEPFPQLVKIAEVDCIYRDSCIVRVIAPTTFRGDQVATFWLMHGTDGDEELMALLESRAQEGISEVSISGAPSFLSTYSVLVMYQQEDTCIAMSRVKLDITSK